MKNMTMKKFKIFLESGNDCFKVFVPARNEKEAREFVEGNGEVIAIKEVTEEFPISAECVGRALAQFGFGAAEMDLITRTLQMTRIAE